MFTQSQTSSCTAFENFQRIAHGTHSEIRAELKKLRIQRELESILIFDDETGETLDLDGDWQRATEAHQPVEVTALPPHCTPTPVRGPGRPKLGVVAREVTLLPRHWEWLETQPGGASVALRRLVETARKERAPEDRARRSIEATYRFLSVMCGNVKGFEEIARALFRRDWPDVDRLAENLPQDIVNHVKLLSAKGRPDYQEDREIAQPA
jgi:hypothetical protein